MNRPPPTTGAHPDMIRLDSTGFPLVRCPAAKVWAGLLPVTKAQFDYFLGDRTGFDPATYELLMSTCPRASWRDIPEDRPEEVFLSGILPEEAVRFAKWLGGGFRVPSPHEWKAVDALLGTAGTDIDPLLEAAADPKTHPAARSILT